VLASFGGQPRGVYRWLWQHHGELSAAKTEGRRINWVGVTEALTAMGITGAKGQKLKPQTVRTTWNRLLQDIAAKEGEPGKVPEISSPKERSPEMITEQPEPAATDIPPVSPQSKPGLWSGWRNRKTTA
jgi:hypothetical protein